MPNRSLPLILLALLLLALAPQPPALAAHGSVESTNHMSRPTNTVTSSGASSVWTSLSWDGDAGTYSTIQSSNNVGGSNTCPTNGAVVATYRFKDGAGTDAPQPIDRMFTKTFKPSSGSVQACLRIKGILQDGSLVDFGAWNQAGGGTGGNGDQFPNQTWSPPYAQYVGLEFHVHTFTGGSSFAPYVRMVEIGVYGKLPVVPPQVTGASATPAGCAVSISWTQTTDTEGYYLYRSETPGFTPSAASRLATLTDAASTGYTDFSTVTEKTYRYRVSAYNADGEGPASGEVSALTGLCDGTGRGIVGYDGHTGPNVLTLDGVSTAYTGSPAWYIASTAGVCPPVPDYRNALRCVTDGAYSTGIDFNSGGPYAESSDCVTTGWIEWTFPARQVESFHLSAKTYANANAATFAGCLRLSTIGQDGSTTEVKAWHGLGNGVRSDLWHNLSAPRPASGVRLYVGDVNAGTDTPSGGAVIHELDVYHANETYYPFTRALTDTFARYSAPLADRTSLGAQPFQARSFQLGNGEWYVYMLTPRNLSTGLLNEWTFSAAGSGFTVQRLHTGVLVPSWEYAADTLPATACLATLYRITVSGGARAFTPTTTMPVTTDTETCRLSGGSFVPSAYQLGDYKVTADLSARGVGAAEEIGRVYLSTGFPFFPALDGDVSSATFVKDANFTIGPVLFPNGTAGTRATLTLADYPYGWAGNGIFIALGQADDGPLNSIDFEILLNGRPMSVVFNGASFGYEYAIFYVDDQARRRDFTEPDTSDVLEGNRRVHGRAAETYEFTIKKGFRPDVPIRVMRSFGSEGHSILTCRDFCSGNVRLETFKLPIHNQNRVNLTVRDAQGAPIQSARITDNVTGQIFFTDAQGRIMLTDRYVDTLFVVSKDGHYSKCLAYEYATAQGTSITTVEKPCASSEAYPLVRAQNLEYTLILYPIGTTSESTTTFNEVPVEVVTLPQQGIVFRGNVTRILPDQFSVQIQRAVAEDLRVTLFRFDPQTGALRRVTDPVSWPASSTANPLLFVYPSGRATTAEDVGAYHLLVQRGSTYVAGVNLKLASAWGLHDALQAPDVTTDTGDALAEQVARELDQAAQQEYQDALRRAAGKINVSGPLDDAALLVPLILLLLIVGLILRNF